MKLHLIRRYLTAVITFGVTAALPAQQRASVNIVVRNEKGDSLPFARVQAANTQGLLFSTTTNNRGRLTVPLPFGEIHFTVSTLGHEAVARDQQIAQSPTNVEFVLKQIARKLSNVETRATWIGVRGGIGDEATREAIAGVVISSRLAGLRIESDSAGRFEIPLEKARAMVLQLERPGYQTRPVQVAVRNDGPTDVVFFMVRGNNVKGEKTRYAELDRRVKAAKLYAFTANRSELMATKKTTLYDALESSGILLRNHLQMGRTMCLYIDGIARPYFPVNTVEITEVDFVEVYGQRSEVTGTLGAEWPRGVPCTSHDLYHAILGTGEGKRYVSIVSVWTRK